VQRLRDAHRNLAGMKVSDRSFEEVEPYLGLGLDVFVGSEPLIPQAMAAGAKGSVSGLATAFPELVAGVVADPTAEGGERLAAARKALAVAPNTPGLKRAMARRGVPLTTDVRAPLRGLRPEEERAIDAVVDDFGGAGGGRTAAAIGGSNGPPQAGPPPEFRPVPG
jgi:dihydrodipicolinate synthase/N-acetylneuraminate lyase